MKAVSTNYSFLIIAFLLVCLLSTGLHYLQRNEYKHFLDTNEYGYLIVCFFIFGIIIFLKI
jgi:uncharacterized membrane protein